MWQIARASIDCPQPPSWLARSRRVRERWQQARERYLARRAAMSRELYEQMGVNPEATR